MSGFFILDIRFREMEVELDDVMILEGIKYGLKWI